MQHKLSFGYQQSFKVEEDALRFLHKSVSVVETGAAMCFCLLPNGVLKFRKIRGSGVPEARIEAKVDRREANVVV